MDRLDEPPPHVLLAILLLGGRRRSGLGEQRRARIAPRMAEAEGRGRAGRPTASWVWRRLWCARSAPSYLGSGGGRAGFTHPKLWYLLCTNTVQYIWHRIAFVFYIPVLVHCILRQNGAGIGDLVRNGMLQNDGSGRRSFGIEPLMEQYSVDLYLCGHEHNYERLWPVLNGSFARNSSFVKPGKPVHIVTGAGGAYGKDPFTASQGS